MRARVAARISALATSWRSLVGDFQRSRSAGRELAVLWVAWFLVLCAEKFTPNGDKFSNELAFPFLSIFSALLVTLSLLAH